MALTNHHEPGVEQSPGGSSQEQLAGTRRSIWTLVIAGLALLILGWATVTLHSTEPAHIIAKTVIFLVLGSYGFSAAVFVRRLAVDMEKKLRLNLLVHNLELETMAMRDDLTQLFNRRYLFERLEQELAAARGFERPMSVIVIDIDSLKDVNDTYGHRTGDRLLAAFGRFLLAQTRASDVPARIGGDEFAVILPDTAESAAEVMMNRLQQALESSQLLDEQEAAISLSASLGVSGYPWGGDTVDAILGQADASMYANKRARKSVLTLPADEESGGAPVPTMFRRMSSEDASG
jgi:diguanylate cyclase (GGDEF)-like protein